MTAAEYKALRKKVGTQAEVSALLQVSRVTVAKRETGAMVITEEAALSLSALLISRLKDRVAKLEAARDITK